MAPGVAQRRLMPVRKNPLLAPGRFVDAELLVRQIPYDFVLKAMIPFCWL